MLIEVRIAITLAQMVEVLIKKTHKEIFWGHRNALHPVLGSCYKGVYMCH